MAGVQAHGEILDDSKAVEALTASKNLADEIALRQSVAEKTEASIDTLRAQFQDVASAACKTFFVVDSMQFIHPYYRFSLQWFIAVYVNTLQSCPTSDPVKLTGDVVSRFLSTIHGKVVRSLFQQHKLAFSFMLAARVYVDKDSGVVGGCGDHYWSQLIGDVTGFSEASPQPSTDKPDWLSGKQWQQCVELAKVLH